MKRWVTLLALSLLLTTGIAAHAQTDADGDGIPDVYDSCAQEAGAASNAGCPPGVTPDFDGDGVADFEDLCAQEAGEALRLGCTEANFPDYDKDGVADPLDACPDQVGAADNSGCPADVVPDLDYDGLPDSQDDCPRESGPAEGRGCPPDADADRIPDYADACPNQAGITGNYGCAEGALPPDGDGDSLPDQFDRCPTQAGPSDMSGCPDADGDKMPDASDRCPDVAGDPSLLGCARTESVTLPAVRAPITAANAAQVRELGRLILGTPSFALSPNGVLAARGSQKVMVYDVGAAQLVASAATEISTSGDPIGISADGQYVATTEIAPDFQSPAFVALRSAQTGQTVLELRAQQDGAPLPVGISQIAFSPTLPLLAMVESAGMGINGDQPSAVVLYSVPAGQKIATLPHPGGVAHLAWSRDGARLATDTLEARQQMMVYVWDVASQTRIAAIPTSTDVSFVGTPMAFSPDGARLAVGKPDGSLSVYDVGTGAEVSRAQVFDAAQTEVVSAVAYSPTGGVIAAGGGVPFSGGLTGQEIFGIALIDPASGNQVARVDTQESLIHDLRFSDDGTLLLTSAAISIRFYGIAP